MMEQEDKREGVAGGREGEGLYGTDWMEQCFVQCMFDDFLMP